jgi:hypothetical protein
MAPFIKEAQGKALIAALTLAAKGVKAHDPTPETLPRSRLSASLRYFSSSVRNSLNSFMSRLSMAIDSSIEPLRPSARRASLRRSDNVHKKEKTIRTTATAER